MADPKTFDPSEVTISIGNIKLDGCASGARVDAPAPTSTGVAKAGTNNARKIECSKSKHHGFHPEDEECSYCDPAPATTYSNKELLGDWGGLMKSHKTSPITTPPRFRDHYQQTKQYQKVVGVDGQVTWTIKPIG